MSRECYKNRRHTYPIYDSMPRVQTMKSHVRKEQKNKILLSISYPTIIYDSLIKQNPYGETNDYNVYYLHMGSGDIYYLTECDEWHKIDKLNAQELMHIFSI